MMYGDKPSSVSLREWIIRHISKDIEIPEEVCERVIGWSYKKAKEATYIHSSVELSGFGKLIAAKAKIRRRRKNSVEKLEWLQSQDPSSLHSSELDLHQEKIANLILYIEYLDSKNKPIEDAEFQPNMGRVAERSVPTEEVEGDDKEDTGS